MFLERSNGASPSSSREGEVNLSISFFIFHSSFVFAVPSSPVPCPSSLAVHNPNICSINTHFSPGFAHGMRCWYLSIKASHSWTFTLDASAFPLASKLKLSSVVMTMKSRLPVLKMSMVKMPLARMPSRFSAQTARWCCSYSSISCGSSLRSVAK